MKKSRAIRLVLLGSTGLTLAACTQKPPSDATFFAKVEDCIPVKGEAACQAAFLKSESSSWDADAPRFTQKEQCEAEFGAGNCETRQPRTGGSFFMPMIMGHMMGSSFNRPVYRGPNNSALVNTGGKYFNVGSFAGTGQSASFQRGRFTPVQRGGFGSTAASHRTSAGS
jgi:uncharacterized protein YgiB involved in biofilm formation